MMIADNCISNVSHKKVLDLSLGNNLLDPLTMLENFVICHSTLTNIGKYPKIY